MMPFPLRLPLLAALAFGAALALAACDGPAERAEAHRQRAVALAAEGDPERASIEFRNALRLDPANAAARLGFARLLRDGGDVAGALGEYEILAGQAPGDIEAQRERAALAFEAEDFATARAAADAALAVDAQDLRARALRAALDYRDGDRAAAVAAARSVAAADPAETHAQMVLVADRMDAGDAAGALAAADAALAAAPEDQGLHLARLAALEKLGDQAAVGAQIARMAELFPAAPGVAEALAAWRTSQGDLDGAEAALRAAAAQNPDAPEPALAVARFLYAARGPEAATAELDRLAETAADPLPFRRARAGIDFAEGRADAAIAAMRSLLEGAEPSERTRDVSVELAAMLDATGDAAGRDALLDATLAGDPGHVAALKLRARAAIAADDPDRALDDMRRALERAPRDPEIMTIMAIAQERRGARQLAGERLASAVDLSGRAPAESLRYARFLMDDGRLDAAATTLAEALEAAPDDPGLLGALGQVEIVRRNWAEAERIAARLRAVDEASAADEIETAALLGQGREAEARDLMRARAAAGDLAARAQLVQAYVAEGDLAAAAAEVDAARAAAPGDPAVDMMQAGLWAAEGETDQAAGLYGALIAADPARPEPHRALAALLAGAGRAEEARAAAAAGIAATGGDMELLVLQAGLLEEAGDYEGAIAAYETLYARDGADLAVANNLASLLSTRRDDPESLERAYAVARRLRGADDPHLQDTYGWILHRRGDSAQAATILGPAAAALPDDALVQYHLGEALTALGWTDEARRSFERAVAAAEADPAQADLPQVAAARARLAEIAAGGGGAAPRPAGDGG